MPMNFLKTSLSERFDLKHTLTIYFFLEWAVICRVLQQRQSKIGTGSPGRT